MPSRYDRQTALFGEDGQEKLRKARVGIAGCGGLGNIVVTDLASAGVGYMMVVDGDSPDITNLNRQFVFREDDDRGKSDILSEWACDINPDIEVGYYEGDITDENIDRLFDSCEILVDCLDSMEARFVLNRYAVRSGKILVHAGVSGLNGQITVIIPGKTKDLEDIYRNVKVSETHPPSVAAMVTMVGSVQALQVIKLITGVGDTLIGKMVVFDALQASVDIIDLG